MDGEYSANERDICAATKRVIGRCWRVPNVDVLPMGRLVDGASIAPQIGHGKPQLVPEPPIVPRYHGARPCQYVHDRVHRQHRPGHGGDQHYPLLAPRRTYQLQRSLQCRPELGLRPLELQELDTHEQDQLAGCVRRRLYRVAEKAGPAVHVPIVQTHAVPVVLELLADLTSDQVGIGRTVQQIGVVQLLAVLTALERRQWVLAQPHTVPGVGPQAHILPEQHDQRNEHDRQHQTGQHRDQQRQIVDEVVVDDRTLHGSGRHRNNGRPLSLAIIHHVRERFPTGTLELAPAGILRRFRLLLRLCRRPVAAVHSLEPVEQFGQQLAGTLERIALQRDGPIGTIGPTARQRQ
uniref:Uncharacterized protein n=1 Tax=Anopheles coluzzii TaxID=1518534 RepID=A0A8W7PW48_ANOCL